MLRARQITLAMLESCGAPTIRGLALKSFGIVAGEVSVIERVFDAVFKRANRQAAASPLASTLKLEFCAICADGKTVKY